MSQEFVPVIFLGNKGTYGIVRAFYEAYQVKSEVIASFSAGPVANSKILNLHLYPSLIDQVEITLKQVIQRIDKLYPGLPKLAVASEDTFTENLVAYRHLFPEHWTIPYVDQETLETATNKSKFYQACEEVGVAYPKTWEVNDGIVPNDATGKLIIKPAVTTSYQNLKFDGKHKIYFCENSIQAQEAISLMVNGGYPDTILVQEWIQAGDQDDVVITGYRSPHDKKMKLFSFGQVLVEDKSASAAGNHLAIMPQTGHKDIYEDMVKLIEHYDWTGFANFDLRYDHNRQGYVFFELNPRLGLSSYYVTAGGQNVAKYYVEDYLFNRGIEDSFKSEPAIFTVLPKIMVTSAVKGTKYEQSVHDLYKKRKVFNPLNNPVDQNLKRNFYVKMSELKYLVGKA